MSTAARTKLGEIEPTNTFPARSIRHEATGRGLSVTSYEGMGEIKRELPYS